MDIYYLKLRKHLVIYGLLKSIAFTTFRKSSFINTISPVSMVIYCALDKIHLIKRFSKAIFS